MEKKLLSTALIMLALTISACSPTNSASSKANNEASSVEPTSSEEEDPPIIDNSGLKTSMMKNHLKFILKDKKNS